MRDGGSRQDRVVGGSRCPSRCARYADDRVGTFTTTTADDANDPTPQAAGEAAFPLGVPDARGEVPGDSPETDRCARDYFRNVVTHDDALRANLTRMGA